MQPGVLIRATTAIEGLHEKFEHRIKTQTMLPLAETAATRLRALPASDLIVMREVDG